MPMSRTDSSKAAFLPPDPVDAIVERVFARATADDSYKAYPPGHIKVGNGVEAGRALHVPRAPGELAYNRFPSSFAATGADPGGDPRDIAVNVPQELIGVARKSFLDGLALAFPDDAMKALFATRTAAAGPYTPSGHYTALVDDMETLPRILPRPSRYTDPRHANRITAEFDMQVRHMADDTLFTPRHDRRQLSNADLVRTYNSMYTHPESFVALRLWQTDLEIYADKLWAKMVSLSDAYPHKRGKDLDDAVKKKFPFAGMVNFGRVNFHNVSAQLFFIAAASAHADPGQAPTAADFVRGIQDAQVAGVFRRKYETPFGTRSAICPMGATAVRWLAMDLGQGGGAGDSVIGRYLAKARRDMAHAPELQMIRDTVRRELRTIIDGSDKGAIIEAKARCPFHRAP